MPATDPRDDREDDFDEIGNVVNLPDEETVDLDLDKEDARLREAVGRPIKVRIDGKVMHITHPAGWSNQGMRAAAEARWEEWAEQVIDDGDELKVFLDADLLNYQFEAIFAECVRQGRVSRGKSRTSSRSSTRMKKR